MTSPVLPIAPFKVRIVEALSSAGSLILTAPTGSGKSTQTPRFLLGRFPGKVLVLEPRRLAARSLAARVAAEENAPLGGTIGYQVRFDSRPGSAVTFQTYGVFIQQMLKAPDLPGVGAVVLDEFHERTLECDLALAWLRALRAKRRPDLKLVVMSATLDAGALAAYLPEAARVDVPGRLYPVAVRHFPPADARRGPEEAALAALTDLAREGLDGSVLVFMPGMREIRRTVEAMGPLCRAQGLTLQSLHGSMELSEQQAVLAGGKGPRVIVATNVAETGLTVPGVTAVIDSGLARVAAYDAARDLNTLRLGRISLANAAQRAGRAGRTAPGRCVRLWARTDELAMAPDLPAEMARLELSAAALQAASLPEPVAWLSAPPKTAWESAARSLSELGAVDAAGRITPRGRALLAYPLPPRLAAVLAGARGMGLSDYERACAMAALFETSGDRRPDEAHDLLERGEDLLSGARREFPWEAVEVYKQLTRLAKPEEPAEPAPPDALARLWLSAFPGRLAAHEGDGRFYRLLDGNGVTLGGTSAPPPLLLVLEARAKVGGGQAKQATATLYLPLSLATLERAFPGESAWKEVSEFDERQKRVVKEERLQFRGLVLARREAAREKGDRRAAAELWAEKFAAGELRHPGLDEKAQQLVTRIRVARGLYPDLGLPAMDQDDWRLVYSEVCTGKNTLKDIERVPLEPHILSYLGPALAAFLDRSLPTGRKMPNGKTGRFTYFEGRPPELAARLGDFLKMTGTLALCDGRLPVLFDILAPNYRTVQKTPDLASFWKNTYPEVKKELKRRYPKHPWP
jgi:ATP-dependent helicase HrpB